jgi:hypothetical protein
MERPNLFLRTWLEPNFDSNLCSCTFRSSIKVITITGLIILGIILDLGG